MSTTTEKTSGEIVFKANNGQTKRYVRFIVNDNGVESTVIREVYPDDCMKTIAVITIRRLRSAIGHHLNGNDVTEAYKLWCVRDW